MLDLMKLHEWLQEEESPWWRTLMRISRDFRALHKLIRVTSLLALSAGVTFGSACSPRPASTDAEARFRGQIVQIVVGRTAGGTYDLYTRAMSQHLGRHLPGNPKVVVENMPGAGGLLALKYLAHQARPDGLTIGLVGLPGIMAQVTDDPEAQEDASHLHALGSPSDDVPVCVFSRTSQIDLDAWRSGKTRPRLGVTSYGTQIYVNTSLITAALHLRAQMILGYKGTAEIRQAMTSRELEGSCVGLDSYLSTFEPKDEYLVAVQLGGERSDLAAVPALSNLVTDERGKELVDAARLMGRVSRFYAVPADTPGETVAVLRNAFDDTMRDPEFLRTAQLAHLPINSRSGVRIEQSVSELLHVSPDVRDRVSAILKPPTP
jgi:tripartite-type tricarboxylate transporter receptor subunit TctC